MNSNGRGELFELFQWKTKKEIFSELFNTNYRIKIEEGLADVSIYLFAIAEIVGVYLKHATLNKIKKNAKKYPLHHNFKNK